MGDSFFASKKSVLKLLSVKDAELLSSKSVKILGDLSCSKVTCDSIEINPTGNKTEIKDAEIVDSTVDSTPIGESEPSLGTFTKLTISSMSDGQQSLAFTTDGDINITDLNEQSRQINSLTSLTLKSSDDLTLRSTNNMKIIAGKKLDINVINNININTEDLAFNTTNLLLNTPVSISKNADSIDSNTGSLVIKGGIGLTNNINLDGTITCNNTIDSINMYTGSIYKGGLVIKKNLNSYQNVKLNYLEDSTSIDSGTLIIEGGVGIKKNVNIGSVTTFHKDKSSTDYTNGTVVIKGGIGISNNMNINGCVFIYNTNESNNYNNGSLIVTGGVGIEQNMNILGYTRSLNTTISENINTGSIITQGGLAIQKNLSVGTLSRFYDPTISTNINNGSLIINGGMAIQKNLNVGTLSRFYDPTISTNINNGAFIVNGGVAIQKNLSVGTLSRFYDPTISTNINNGAFIVNGGAAIQKNLNVGTLSRFYDPTISTNINNGAVIVDGGMAIQKNLSVGTLTTFYDTTETSNYMDGSVILKGGMGITKNMNINGSIAINNNLYVNNNVNLYSNLNVHNDVNMYSNLNISNGVNLLNKTDSNDANSGTLIIDGGIGIKKNIVTSGHLLVQNTSDILNNNGSIISEGGAYIKKSLKVKNDALIKNNLSVDGISFFNNISDSYDSNTGSVIIEGGLGIKKNLNIDGIIKVTNNTPADENTKEAALMVDGGAYIKERLLVDTIVVRDTLVVTSNLTVKEGADFQSKIGAPQEGDFDDLEGSIGIKSDLFFPDTFQKIDNWINTNLIDTPPIPTDANNTNITTLLIEFNWIVPERFYVGFLDKKMPNITSIYIEYKLSSTTWDNSVKLNMGSETVNKVIIYATNFTNYLDGDTYHLYNIIKETDYDFRIYCINENYGTRPYKYLYYNNLKTNPVGVPSSPNNVIINNISQESITINWVIPTYSDELNSNNDILINKYSIEYNSTESTRYPTFIDDDQNTTVDGTISSVPDTSLIINSLNPGHKYDIKISAKNQVNENYGTIDISSIQTLYPSSPNFINSNNLYIKNSGNFTYDTVSAYHIDGLTIANKIYDYNKLDLNVFQTNTLSNIRINENISSSSDLVSSVTTYLNNIQYAHLDLKGFSYTNNSTNFSNNINVIINNENDYHSSNKNKGFYKKANIKMKFSNPETVLIPSTQPYNLMLQQTLHYSNQIFNTQVLTFYIEDFNKDVEISNIHISSITDYTISYVSGVPAYVNGKFYYSLIARNLANNFLRGDRLLFTSKLIDSNNESYSLLNDITDNLIKTSYNYYDLNETLHNTNGTTLLPNTEYILFKNLLLNLMNISLGYTEQLLIKINGHNIFSSNNIYTDNTSLNIRLDYNSLDVINNLNNSNSSYGSQVFSGASLYPLGPSNSNNEFGEVYDHQVRIDIGTYNSELQLVNGYFCNNGYVNSFKNYQNYFIPTNETLDYYDYSQATQQTRYVTFKYTNLIDNINKLTINFINSHNFTEIEESNISLHIKIYNSSDNTNNTGWLDANKIISGVGITNTNKDIDGTSCLVYNNQYKSTSTKKYVYIPNGSIGDLYVRFGINININKYLKYISVSADFV